MEYLISILIGYLSGSFPTAFLILKKKKGLDITITGSGNVGAMNSYEITNSKKIGFVVFLIDFLKGIIPVIILSLVFNYSFSITSYSLIFAVFSHCFNPWINFKGGRGLATAAGGILILFYPLLICWVALWTLTFLVKKNIILSNVLATLFSLFFCVLLSKNLISLTFPKTEIVSELILFISAGLIIIFIKHIEPLKEIIINK
jgi:acyl phosphate:glycerol-3-phosphate acyltransferase